MTRYRVTKLLSIFLVLLLFCFLGFTLAAQASLEAQRDQIQNEVRNLGAEIELAQSECDAIDSRLRAINKSIVHNYVELEEAESKCLDKQEEFNARLRKIYKNGDIGLLEVLLNVEDFEDFLLRFAYLQKINQSDLKLLDSCREKKEEISSIRRDLEKAKAEAVNLKQQKAESSSQLKSKLIKEQILLDNANAELQKQLKAQREERKIIKQKYAANSAPLGTVIGIANCSVTPYLSDVYITSERMPVRYQATGIKFSGIASWYGNEFNGQRTASGEIFNENDFTCASRTLAFGTFLSVRYGDRRIVVKVTDRGPFIKGRILDLSKRAAQALGISGIGNVDAEVIEPE